MKPIIQKLWMFMVMLCASISASAYDFELPAGNGMQKLQYSILSSVDQTVAVVGGTTGIIPCSVTYNNKNYTVTEIGRFAFSDVNITDYRLPLSLKAIRENAFGFNKASTIAIPDGVEIIESGAFWYSSVETIIIGSGVKNIGDGAFYGCSNLKTLVFRPQKAPTHVSRNYSIGNGSTTVIVPQLYGYEGSEIARVVAGTMIEPIYFKQNQFVYSGMIPELDYVLKINSASAQSDMTLKNKDAGVYEQFFYIELSQIIPSYRFSDFDGYAVYPNRGVDVLYEYTINKKPLFVKIENQQRLYGESNPSSFSYSIDGFVDGEDENQFLSPVKCETTASLQSPVGSYPITCNPSALNYSFEIQQGTLNIQKAPIDIAIQNSSRVYGDGNPSYQYNYDGLRCDDSSPEITSSLQFTNIDTSADCGEYRISIVAGEFRNYYINKIYPGILSVTPAPLELKVNDAQKEYGENNPVFSYTLNGLRNNDTNSCILTQPTYVCKALLTSDCGEYDITASNASAKNYNISYQGGRLTITKAPLTLIVSNVSREYGEANPILKYTANGLKGDDTLLSALSEDPMVSTTSTESSNIGEYPIVIWGGTSTNYSLSYRSGILTVAKAPLTVIAENAERQYGESNPVFARLYSGFKLDDTESTAFSSLPRLSCAATRTSDVGEYPIVVSGGTSRNYEVVSYENGILNITKAPLTLVATDKSRLYFEENPSFDFILTGLRNSDTKSCLTIQPTFKCAAAKTSNAGEYEIEPLNATAQNYAIDYQKGTLSINKRNLTASVCNYTKIYGSENPQFEINYIGFVNNEDKSALTNAPNIVCSANKASDVGSYPISLDGGNALNYDISKYIPGTLIIEKADQIITWNQDLSNIQMYSQVALEASSNADLPVSYEMSPNNVASLYNNNGKWYLDCFGSGAVNIRAVQNGDKNHNSAPIVSNTLVVMGTGGDPSNPQIFLNIENAGTLPNLIADNRKYQIKNLRLTGYLNGTDINFLREMAGSDSYGNTTPGTLETLDISGCTIVSGGRSYYKSSQTSNNKVGDYMFYNCKQLVNLMLPDNTTVIEDFAFANCDRLSVISIPEKVKAFGVQSFCNDISLLRIPMPSGLTSINNYSFMGCNGLSEITIPANVTNIGDGIVKDCQNISKINVVEGNSHFASENGVLYTSTFDELLIFPVNYESSSYIVKDGTKIIAPYAFVNSKRLSDVTLPSTLTNIGADAFIGCVNLLSLQVKALNPPVCDNDCFEAVSKTRCELIVPKGCYSYYWVAPVWSDFNKIKESDFSGIDDILYSDIRVGVENGNIVIGGVPESIEVRIFKIDGTLIYQAPSTGDVFYYCPAQSGIYIIVIGNKTYKLTVH